MATYQLPGPVGSPSPGPRFPLLPILFVLVLLAPAAWLATRSQLDAGIGPVPEEEPSVEEDSFSQPIQEENNAHLQLHALHLREKLELASEHTRKAQKLIRRVAPQIRKDTRSLARDLEAADHHQEKVMRELVESIEELQMLQDNHDREENS